MSTLVLKNVFKDYKLASKEKFRALNDINVSFDKGELVSIVGESGSGKSTLMNLIGGLDSDYEGEIKINGKDLKSFKEKQLDDYRKKNIGFVFQSFNLIPHLSVLDNVTIPLTLSNEKDSVKTEKAMQLLTKLGLKEHAKKKPNQLSGGQKQRVAIARALIGDPDIILADEPTGALDSSTTLQILDILKEIADEGKLVIMVTHSEKVAKISSRVVELSDGQIIRDEINKDYKKEDKKEEIVLAKEQANENKPKKEKHLSFISALKHSFHSMWASKTKNILMSIGVSIALVAMIIMLSFGSGLTGYISNVASDYTNPNYVTISKSGKNRDGTEIEGSSPSTMFLPRSFSEEEVEQLMLDINEELSNANKDFRVAKNGENANISYGFNILTMSSAATATVTYTPPDAPENSKTKNIIYTYTTPPYYGEHNLLSDQGTMPKTDEIMLSAQALDLLGVEEYNDAIGKQVTLYINMKIGDVTYTVTKTVTVTAIVDVSMFSGMAVMYIDYDYLDSCIREAQNAKGEEVTGISPSLIFIQTDKEETTDFINNYIKTKRADLSGSIEEQMASMFGEMLSTFSIALAVIAGISLFVALIMILVVLYMSVSERTKEIGVLKSIGARKKDIRLIFSTESLLIGLLSGTVGIILAAGIGGILTLVLGAVLGFAPIAMQWQYFALALGISVIISVIAGISPSSKAAKLDPVEALRRD